MKGLKNWVSILLGNAVLAFGIAAFIVPTGIICGGTTGIGLALKYWLNIPLPVTVALVNAAAFVAGWILLGRKFAAATAVSTIAFPLFLDLFTRVEYLSHLTDDLLLSAVMAGVITGAGVGMVLKAGASTGGMDIPPLVGERYFSIPISHSMLALNCLVLLMQIPFSDTERVLYGLVNTAMMAGAMNRMMMYGLYQTQAIIITPLFERVRETLLANDFGVTMILIETGKNLAAQKALLCAVPLRRLALLKQLVQGIDEESFVMINTGTEIKGRGFSIAREGKRQE